MQRLMDVTEQREKVLRMQVLAAWRKSSLIRRRIMMHRQSISRTLSELASLDLATRLLRQQVFMNAAPAHQQVIEALEKQLEEAQAQRQELTEKLMQVRSRIKTLERLREEARSEHLRQELAVEQKQFDENAHITFVRLSASRS